MTKKYCDGPFLDLKITVKNLTKDGINGITYKWFKILLEIQSDSKKLIKKGLTQVQGVLQGSILDPMFSKYTFKIYIQPLA
jgi:hypothetical protein